MLPSALIAAAHTLMPSKWAVTAASASTATASRTGAVTANPNEKPTPTARQCAAKPWVAPAESDRTSTLGESGSPGRGRWLSGSAASAWSSTAMWSAVVFEPAFPARSGPARASPPAMSGRSRNASSG